MTIWITRLTEHGRLLPKSFVEQSECIAHIEHSIHKDLLFVYS